MSTVDGVYDCVAKTPMGDQASVFTVVSNGSSFNGTNSGPMGSLDVSDGQVDGNRLTWEMKMTVPMPMTLKCEAIVEGNSINGSLDTGMFGKFTMSGTRRG